MLKAVLHGKAGRIGTSDSEKISWSSLFKTHEDLMTAAVFGRFAYLSPSVQALLLKQWLGINEAEHDFEQFEDIEFWPKFDLVEGDDSCFVEPDLVLRFKEFNLIIEVKPPAGGDQYFEQWRKEIASFLQSDNKNYLPLYFLAIGRIGQYNAKGWARDLIAENDERLQMISALKWQPVTDSIVQLRHPISISIKSENVDVITSQDIRILDDIIAALHLYGLKTANFKWKHLIKNNSFKSLSLAHSGLSKDLNHFNTTFYRYKNNPLSTLTSNDHKALSLDVITLWPRTT